MRFQYNIEDPPFNLGDISLVSVQREADYKHSYKKGRALHGFIYVVKGRLLYSFSELDVGNIEIKRGEILFVPKGSIYTATYLDTQNEISIVQFDTKEAHLPEFMHHPAKVSLGGEGELSAMLFLSGKGENHSFYYLSRLWELLLLMERSTGRVPAKYKKLTPALAAINNDFYKNEKIERYASLCGMSETGFRRLFREFTGKSPIEYRNHLRLENARNKLKSGEYNVSEAAQESGFTNLSFFTRLYKEKFGYTPKKE